MSDSLVTFIVVQEGSYPDGEPNGDLEMLYDRAGQGPVLIRAANYTEAKAAAEFMVRERDTEALLQGRRVTVVQVAVTVTA